MPPSAETIVSNEEIGTTGIFRQYAIVLATVRPTLIPVKDPGPFTANILSISFGSILETLKASAKTGIILLEVSWPIFLL